MTKIKHKAEKSGIELIIAGFKITGCNLIEFSWPQKINFTYSSLSLLPGITLNSHWFRGQKGHKTEYKVASHHKNLLRVGFLKEVGRSTPNNRNRRVSILVPNFSRIMA